MINRNRYNAVTPWGTSRVRLKRHIDGSDYIDASPIILTSNIPAVEGEGRSTLPLPTRLERNYIATQAPQDETLLRFWQMVLQESSGAVGVIIRLFGGIGEKRFRRYYPNDMENPTITISTPRPEEEKSSEGGDTTYEDKPAVHKSSGDIKPNARSRQKTDTNGGESNQDGASEDETAITQQPHISIPGSAPSIYTQPPPMLTGGTDIEPNKIDRSSAGIECTVTLLSSYYDRNIGCEVRTLRLKIGEDAKTIHHYFFDAWPVFELPEGGDQRSLVKLMQISKTLAGDSPASFSILLYSGELALGLLWTSFWRCSRLED